MSSYVKGILSLNAWCEFFFFFSGLKGAALHSAYCSSKHALVGLTKAVAVEMATFGITCNAICPGWVATPPLMAELVERAKQNGVGLEEQIRLFLK